MYFHLLRFIITIYCPIIHLLIVYRGQGFDVVTGIELFCNGVRIQQCYHVAGRLKTVELEEKFREARF